MRTMSRPPRRVSLMKAMPLILSTILLGCSSNDTTTDAGQDAQGNDVATQDVAQDSPTQDAGTPQLTQLVTTNGAAYELAEGLAVFNGKAYIGFAPTGAITQIDSAGTKVDYGHV